MAFHFPLVARLFKAFADQTAAPIIDIVTRSAHIPASCQWAVFLRNHDDLSLSALGAGDNDRLMDVYAPDDRMRLHGGIRRRLAPMLGHDPRRIELAHAVLFSLPGTPIIYYGDEIGMSDRLDLDDRDGLRTPMQWDATAHGGFTTGASATIPANDHARWGFNSLNVASVVDAPDSLLDRLAAMLRIRREHPAFGRGTVMFLDTKSPSILALQRHHAGDTVLFVGNLSSEPQVTGIDVPRTGVRLSPARDRDLLPPAPGLLELAPYEWHWWSLAGD